MKQVLSLVLCLVICVFIIITYGTYRCRTPSFEDPFTKCIAGNNYLSRYIDGWGLLHFWFFAMLSYVFPTLWKQLIIAGILWEIVEMIFKEHPFYLSECNLDTDKGEGWWYGRWEDIVMNSLGIVVGFYLHKIKTPFSIFPLGFISITVLQFSIK